MRAREFLETAVVFGARLDQLEQVTGCDRWQLSLTEQSYTQPIEHCDACRSFNEDLFDAYDCCCG